MHKKVIETHQNYNTCNLNENIGGKHNPRNEKVKVNGISSRQ